MTRTNNLSNTQFGYQIVFFIHIHGYIWLAEGCRWHLLPRQNLQRETGKINVINYEILSDIDSVGIFYVDMRPYQQSISFINLLLLLSRFSR